MNFKLVLPKPSSVMKNTDAKSREIDSETDQKCICDFPIVKRSPL